MGRLNFETYVNVLNWICKRKQDLRADYYKEQGRL